MNELPTKITGDVICDTQYCSMITIIVGITKTNAPISWAIRAIVSTTEYEYLDIACVAAYYGASTVLDAVLITQCSNSTQEYYEIPEHAARNGHINCLKIAKKYGFEWTARLYGIAAYYGHLETIKWIKNADLNSSPNWNTSICSSAALNGHLDIIKWARTYSPCPWDVWTCAYAAEGGHLETLKWVRQHGCPWDVLTCGRAAIYGHLETLKWAREHGCPWDKHTCSNAAKFCHIEVLKWARLHGCPWNIRECNKCVQHWKNDKLAKHLYFDVYEWARENNCT